MLDRQLKSHRPQTTGTFGQSQVSPLRSTVTAKTVEFDPPSARFAPVKYLFTRKGLVRVSIVMPEGGSIETRVESAIEVALPFVNDFAQNCQSGGTIELKVSWLFCFQSRLSPHSIQVYLQTRKSGETDVCPDIATQTCSRALNK